MLSGSASVPGLLAKPPPIGVVTKPTDATVRKPGLSGTKLPPAAEVLEKIHALIKDTPADSK